MCFIFLSLLYVFFLLVVGVVLSSVDIWTTQRKVSGTKAKKATEEVNENVETAEIHQPPTQRRRINSRSDFGVSGAIATRLDKSER